MWTAKKYDKGFDYATGQAFVRIAYTNDADGNTLFESASTRVITTDWADENVNRRLAELNGLNLALIVLGVPGAPKPPTPPLAGLKEFQAARNLWFQETRKFESADLTGTKQADVDAAYAVMKGLWQPAFGVFI